MFDVDNVALDRMAEAQWHRLLNQNMVIEMPADPSVNPTAAAAVKAVGKDGAKATQQAGGISKEAYKENLSRLRDEVAKEIKGKKGYRIEFLDRTLDAEKELGRIFKDPLTTKKSKEAARAAGKKIESDPLAYAVQNPDMSGEKVCMAILLKPETKFK